MVGYIIVGVIVALVIGISAYFILRFLRGKIIIELESYNYDFGEEIEGEFILTTKKQLEGNDLTVALVGDLVTVSYDNEDRKQTNTREVYRNTSRIEGSKTYPSGYNKTYSLNIETQESESDNDSTLIDGIKTISKIAEFASDVMNDRNKYYKWYVEVRLDCKGIDLYKKVPIQINGFN